MSNKVKDIDIKIRIYYFLNDIKNIKIFDPNNIKIDDCGYVTIKDSKCVKIYSVNPLCLIFNKVNGHFEEINGNKYLTLVPTNESKEKIKKYGEIWSKISDLLRSVTKNTVDYDEKYMKVKFNSDNELPLNKTVKIPTMTIVKDVFHENNKYYLHVFLVECLYRI